MVYYKTMLTFILACVCIGNLGSCDAQWETKMICSREYNPSYHVRRLKSGDFRLADYRPIYSTEPYHLAKLIDMGQKSANDLIRLLHDDSLVLHGDSMKPIEYFGTLEFSMTALTEYTELRQATMGDIADYALRAIYGTDVGYRSYHSKKKREEAIQKWKRVVEKGVVPAEVVQRN